MNPNDPSSAAPAAPRLSLAIDRAVIRHRGESVRHLVCTVEAPPAPVDPARLRLPLHLALVLDVSGSMSGGRLRAARTAAAQVVASLGDGDRVSLVSFATDVVLHADAALLDADGRARVGAAIAGLATRGATDLAAGWLAGCEAVARRLAEVGDAERSHVVVLSDGRANEGIVDPGELARHAGELRERGVRTSTVGIGSGYSPAQLLAIAEAGGGRMHDATESSEIAEVLLAELRDALATTVDGFELALTLPPGVRAQVYGTAPLVVGSHGVRVQLGALLGGASRVCVLKLTFPPGAVGQCLRIDARASWLAPLTGSAHAVDLPSVELRYGRTADCLAQPRDLALALAVVRQWHAFVVHRAMTVNQSGDHRAAHEFARGELRYFARYAEDVPGGRELADALARYAPEMMRMHAGEDAKEILLASYKRGRGEDDRRMRSRGTLEDQMGGLYGSNQP
jgi:Ca-activated chloride channel family protein